MEKQIVEFDEWRDVPCQFTGKCVTKGDRATRYYLNGRLHRIGGPAIEYPEGYKEWIQEGRLHRLDGSAIEYISGRTAYYVKGQCYSKKEFDALPEVIMYKAGLEIFV